MTEIRTIRQDEADRFLALLCQVFDLDIVRAKHVFYKEPMFDLARKWALYEDGEMRSILTTTPLKFGFGDAFGVAGVATDRSHQRRGLGQRLIEHVVQHGTENGEPGCLLFAHRESVYKRCGFETVDMVVRGPILADGFDQEPQAVAFEQIAATYDAWSASVPARLVRDERRWKYWRWIPRACEAAAGGYVCVEPNLCREALVTPGQRSWPVGPGTNWLGLESLTASLGVPLASVQKELFVMSRAVPVQVQMFMTDQF